MLAFDGADIFIKKLRWRESCPVSQRQQVPGKNLNPDILAAKLEFSPPPSHPQSCRASGLRVWVQAFDPSSAPDSRVTLGRSLVLFELLLSHQQCERHWTPAPANPGSTEVSGPQRERSTNF